MVMVLFIIDFVPRVLAVHLPGITQLRTALAPMHHRLYSRLDSRHDQAVRCVETALLRALLVTAVRQKRLDKVRGLLEGL